MSVEFGLIDCFQLFVLAAWALSDYRIQKVPTITLVIPSLLMLILTPSKFVSIFVPCFVFLAALFIIFRRRGLLGMADVIGLPFALIFIAGLAWPSMLVFGLAMAGLVRGWVHTEYDPLLKTKIRNIIVLLPLLFLSSFLSYLVHLILKLLL